MHSPINPFSTCD